MRQRATSGFVAVANSTKQNAARFAALFSARLAKGDSPRFAPFFAFVNVLFRDGHGWLLCVQFFPVR
jgi:hypothetical protein